MSGGNDAKGPLAHVKVLELGGLAPVPYCGQILKQFGADVIHVQRTGAQVEDPAGLGIVRHSRDVQDRRETDEYSRGSARSQST